MWHEIIGTPKQYQGTTGTINLGVNEAVLMVIAHASAGSATIQILNGPAVPIINGANPTIFQYYHTLLQTSTPGAGGSNTIIGTNTDMIYVHTVKQGNT